MTYYLNWYLAHGLCTYLLVFSCAFLVYDPHSDLWDRQRLPTPDDLVDSVRLAAIVIVLWPLSLVLLTLAIAEMRNRK